MPKYFYSPTSKGFYLEGLHSTMPNDVMEITKTKYTSMLAELSSGAREVYVDGNVPKVRDVAYVISIDDIRAQRDELLTASDWTQMPDNNLTPEQRTAWADYRQLLRDITDTYPDPSTVVWPDAPPTE